MLPKCLPEEKSKEKEIKLKKKKICFIDFFYFSFFLQLLLNQRWMQIHIDV